MQVSYPVKYAFLLSVFFVWSTTLTRADTITIDSGPDSIPPVGPIQVEISYTADQDFSGTREIIVNLLRPSNPTNSQFFGQGVVSGIEAGSSDTLTVNINVINHPAPGADYEISAFIAEEGVEVPTPVFAPLVKRVTVLEGDSIAIASSPTTINPIGTVSVDIEYTASANQSSDERDIVVSLLNPDEGFAFFGGQRVENISVGSGTITVELEVENAPPSGTAYIFSAFIGPAEGEFDKAFAPIVQANVTVDDGDSISITDAPLVIDPRGTVAVEIDYSAVANISEEPRDIVVNLLDPESGFAFFGGTRITGIGVGSDTVTAGFEIVGSPPEGDTYVFCWPLLARPVANLIGPLLQLRVKGSPFDRVIALSLLLAACRPLSIPLARFPFRFLIALNPISPRNLARS